MKNTLFFSFQHSDWYKNKITDASFCWMCFYSVLSSPSGLNCWTSDSAFIPQVDVKHSSPCGSALIAAACSTVNTVYRCKGGSSWSPLVTTSGDTVASLCCLQEAPCWASLWSCSSLMCRMLWGFGLTCGVEPPGGASSSLRALKRWSAEWCEKSLEVKQLQPLT